MSVRDKMAALGRLETDWRASIKATVLMGSDKFIQKMLGILKGDRREQTGRDKFKKRFCNLRGNSAVAARQ
jgi:hypothetical protein